MTSLALTLDHPVGRQEWAVEDLPKASNELNLYSNTIALWIKGFLPLGRQNSPARRLRVNSCIRVSRSVYGVGCVSVLVGVQIPGEAGGTTVSAPGSADPIADPQKTVSGSVEQADASVSQHSHAVSHELTRVRALQLINKRARRKAYEINQTDRAAGEITFVAWPHR